jgi:hypothetical protein
MTAVITVPGSTMPDDWGGVVPAVLLEVTLFTRGFDALGDLLATVRRELRELRREAVVGLLREPGDGGVLRHGALLR